MGQTPIKDKRSSGASICEILRVALELFSTQGYRATSIRQIAQRTGLSIGNVYHHFESKLAIFRRLLNDYWDDIYDPNLPLNQILASGDFPDNLEKLAQIIEQMVDQYSPYILLIYVDVIEFQGKHIQEFYKNMAHNFNEKSGSTLKEKQERGTFGDVNPLVGLMFTVQWFFYFFTVERCFGAPMYLGIEPKQIVAETIKILRLGLLPRDIS